MTCIDAQAVLLCKDGHVLDGGNFAVDFLDAAEVASRGVPCGAEFHEVGTDLLRCLHLLGFGVDEDACRDVVVLEGHHDFCNLVNLCRDVHARLGRDFLAVLGYERHHVGLHVDGELHHLGIGRNLEVEFRGNRAAQKLEVAVLDVTLVFAQVGNNAVAACEFGNNRCGNRIRFADLACFTDSGDVVYVDTQFYGHGNYSLLVFIKVDKFMSVVPCAVVFSFNVLTFWTLSSVRGRMIAAMPLLAAPRSFLWTKSSMLLFEGL